MVWSSPSLLATQEVCGSNFDSTGNFLIKISISFKTLCYITPVYWQIDQREKNKEYLQRAVLHAMEWPIRRDRQKRPFWAKEMAYLHHIHKWHRPKYLLSLSSRVLFGWNGSWVAKKSQVSERTIIYSVLKMNVGMRIKRWLQDDHRMIP